MPNIEIIANEIIAGRRLTKDDDLSFLIEGDLAELCANADRIRAALCGNRLDLCSIINGRAGRCSENCKFCAQSSHHSTQCDEYGFLSEEALLQGCAHAHSKGVDRYSIVTAGRTMAGADLERAIAAYERMHAEYPDMILCASHGLMTEADLKRVADAGVTMYHTNVETSRANFPNICTTHSYEDKMEEIRRARAAGLTICSGGILGMGETWQDRVSMACELAELEITSIPLNFLIPIPGTPFGDRPRLTTDEILRIVALFRFLNPTAFIRAAAGRCYFPDGGRAIFTAGANATLTGDMLTTVGNNTDQDRTMLTELGFTLKEENR